jgi:hypothetical protein
MHTHFKETKKMKNNQLEQLLTELTPQEAAIVEGGRFFVLTAIKAKNPTADNNDPRIMFNDQYLFSQDNLNAPKTVYYTTTVEFFSEGVLELWQMNPPAGEAGDLKLGERKIPAEKLKSGRATLGGYEIYYKVT